MNKATRWRRYWWLIVIFFPLLQIDAAHADTGDKFTMNINISGTVVANGHCNFNVGSGGAIDTVSFDKINYMSEGGFALQGDYRKTLDGTMTCTGSTEGATMTFTSTGSSVDFGGHKLLPVMLNGITSNNVAIEVLIDGEVQDLGTAFDVDTASLPVFEAELVQTGSSDTVTSGAVLTASLTLTMAFQ